MTLDEIMELKKIATAAMTTPSASSAFFATFQPEVVLGLLDQIYADAHFINGLMFGADSVR